MSHGEALRKLIRENPGEETPRLAYADWLDENDRPDEAAAVREHRSLELDVLPALLPALPICTAAEVAARMAVQSAQAEHRERQLREAAGQ